MLNCKSCGKQFEPTHIGSNGRVYRRIYCTSKCMYRRRYLKNRKAILERTKRYHHSHKQRAYARTRLKRSDPAYRKRRNLKEKEWRERNKEKNRAYRRAYYRKNRIKILAQNVASAKRNKESINARRRRHELKTGHQKEYRARTRERRNALDRKRNQLRPDISRAAQKRFREKHHARLKAERKKCKHWPYAYGALLNDPLFKEMLEQRYWLKQHFKMGESGK